MRALNSLVLAQETSVDATAESIEWIVLAIVFLIVVTFVGNKMVNKDDRSWLPGLILGGFVLKLAASLARYYMVAVYYGGGDSFAYHDKGRLFAPVWRSLAVPVSTAGGEGTAFTEVTTGLFYGFYTPSMAGGFLMFAFLAYIGQMLFYVAFRPWLPKERLKMYARVVLLLPSLLFWPASIGKDALMMLFIGLALVGASRLLLTYRFSSLLVIAPGVYLASQVRPHVAGMLTIALVLAALFGKPPPEYRSNPKRALMVGLAVLGVVFTLATFSADFGVTVESTQGAQTPDDFLAQVSDRTEQGGSAVEGEGGAIASPAQLPGGVIKVLYRPLIYEGTNPQVILSALEGTTLLLITIWKFPQMWRNKRQLRENPMYLLGFFYTGGFILAFSAINNLGILARQRVQVLPLMLAVLIGLTWDGYDRKTKNSLAKQSDSIGPSSEANGRHSKTQTRRDTGSKPTTSPVR